MKRNASPTTDLALIAVFAALVAAFSLVPAIPVGPVPITLQTLAVALTGMVLGPWRGFLSVLLYLVVGFAGLPVFAKGGSGLGTFASPSIGYLLSFPIAALIIGLVSRYLMKRVNKLTWVWMFVAGLAGSIIAVHPMGIVGMDINTKMDFGAAALFDMTFWPGDLIKNAIAAAIALAVYKAFPQFVMRDEVAQDAPELQATPAQ